MMSLYLGSQNYNAFAFTKSTLSEYPYEGFATYQEAFEMREGLDTSGNIDTGAEPPFLGTESPFPGTEPPVTDTTPNELATAGLSSYDWRGPPKTLSSKPKKSKEGFETMPEQQVSTLAGSTYGDEKPVAFLYNNDANTTCKNYGYTNSKGFICMSDSDIKLLTTRGGNAAGVSDQIGK